MNVLSYGHFIDFIFKHNNELILNALLECINFNCKHCILTSIHLTYSQLLLTVFLLFVTGAGLAAV